MSPEAVERACDKWKLSRRRREIVRIVCLERLDATANIAERMAISERTVENQFAWIYSKSLTNNRTQLVLAVSDFEHDGDEGIRRVV